MNLLLLLVHDFFFLITGCLSTSHLPMGLSTHHTHIQLFSLSIYILVFSFLFFSFLGLVID